MEVGGDAPQRERRVGRLLDRIVWWCLAGVMAAMSLAMLVQVLCRVLLGTAIIWAEEFAVLLFAWSIFLGAALHISVAWMMDGFALYRKGVTFA